MIKDNRFLIFLAGVLFAWKAWAILWMIVAQTLLPLNQTFTFVHDLEYGSHLPYAITSWANFDGIHYILVGDLGYRVGEHPFFPLYPLAMKGLRMITGLDWVVVGILVSHVAFGLAIYWLLKLLKLDTQKSDKKQLPWFWIFWLAFPTSFFYGAVYNDALFLFFSVVCLWFGRKRLWLWAGLAGALATATRLNGVALLIFLVAEYIWGEQSVSKSWQYQLWLELVRKKLSLVRVWHSKIWWAALIPLTLMGYLTYIHITAGNWQLLFSAMEVWDQSQATFPPQVIWRYLKILATVPLSLIYVVALFEFLMVLFYCSVLYLLKNKLHLSYWLFSATTILIPWLTGTFAGMPRYGLHIYPLFLGIWLLLKDRPTWLKVGWIGIGLALQAFVMILFSRGYFVT